MYYYLYNVQGIITGILDYTGTLVVNYSYDAWGNIGKITDGEGTDKTADGAFLGNVNPFRYKGYCYDNETGFYYLQSRYYDPATGRFLNADDTDMLKGKDTELLAKNLFAYCENNPVMESDPSGYDLYYAYPGYIMSVGNIQNKRADVMKVQIYLNNDSGVIGYHEGLCVLNWKIPKSTIISGTYDSRTESIVSVFQGILGLGENRGKVDRATWYSLFQKDQNWFPPQADGLVNGTAYYIQNKKSGAYLDVLRNETQDSATVGQYAYTGLQNQIWKIVWYPKDGLYTLNPMHAPTKHLDINDERRTGNAVIGIYGDNPESKYPWPFSFWSICKVGENTYSILSANSYNEQALTAPGTSVCNMTTWAYNAQGYDVTKQQWVFKAFNITRISTTEIAINVPQPSGKKLVLYKQGQWGTAYKTINCAANTSSYTFTGLSPGAIYDIAIWGGSSRLSFFTNIGTESANKPFKTQYINGLKADIINTIGSGKGVGYHYNTEQAVNIIISYDSYITQISNYYKMPKALIQTILLRELWCVNASDDVADNFVVQYYAFKILEDKWYNMEPWQQAITPYPNTPAIIKTDSSTGLGQIFAATAIDSNNYAIQSKIKTGKIYDSNNWNDMYDMWCLLKSNNQYNIDMITVVLIRAANQKALSTNYFAYTETQYRSILARYNGTGTGAINYGNECYEYFKIFNNYNKK